MDKYVLWAGIVGAFSAISLLIGSVIGVSFKLPKTLIGLFAAFGAGALLSALAIELIAPTITAFTSATNEIDRLRESHHFLVLVIGCAFGGVIFVLLDQVVNAKGGYLRKTAYVLSKVAIERKSFHQKVINELIKSRMFFNLPYEKISLVINHFRPRFFNAGESVFVQGDKSHGIYMIRKGVIEVYQQDHSKPILLGHGEIIGEISFISGRPYSADCVAKTDVELMLLTTHDFESIQKQVPEFEQRLKTLAADRLDENKKFSEQESMEKQRWASLAIDAIHHGTAMPSREEMGSRHGEHKNAAFAIWLGIMLDGIPESFIIGSTIIAAVIAATLAGNEPSFWSILPYTLIAGLFLSNMPEALSSSQQMKLQGMSSLKILLLWGSLVVLTGLGAALGAAISEHVGHGTLIFIEGIAAGAMLTMICAAMLPEAAHLANSNLVGLSTLAGFLCSILFKLLE